MQIIKMKNGGRFYYSIQSHRKTPSTTKEKIDEVEKPQNEVLYFHNFRDIPEQPWVVCEDGSRIMDPFEGPQTEIHILQETKDSLANT